MGKKKKRGRPKKPSGESKPTTITVRVSHAERKALGKAAKDSGRKLSDWVRTSLLAAVNSGKIETINRRVEESNLTAEQQRLLGRTKGRFPISIATIQKSAEHFARSSKA